MNGLKIAAWTALAAGLAITFVFAIAAFAKFSLDFRTWTEADRLITAMISLFVALISGVLTAFNVERALDEK